jgi:hypothetical protein
LTCGNKSLWEEATQEGLASIPCGQELVFGSKKMGSDQEVDAAQQAASGGRPKRKTVPSARAAAALADGQPIEGLSEMAVHREIVQNLVGLLEEEVKSKEEEGLRGGIKGEPVIQPPPPEKKDKLATPGDIFGILLLSLFFKRILCCNAVKHVTLSFPTHSRDIASIPGISIAQRLVSIDSRTHFDALASLQSSHAPLVSFISALTAKGGCD